MKVEMNFYVGLRDADKDLNITDTGILACLENAAGYHSELAGYGASTIDITRKTWVLLNWKVEIKSRPKYNQLLKIVTWSRKLDKFYAYRDFEVFDENKNLVFSGTSKWLLIDIDKGRPVKITDEIGANYHSENTEALEDEEIESLEEPKNPTKTIKYKVTENMIDINNHLHNIYYMDMAREILPEEDKNYKLIEIAYKKEIKSGAKVLISYEKDNDSSIIAIKSEDEQTTHSIIRLK